MRPSKLRHAGIAVALLAVLAMASVPAFAMTSSAGTTPTPTPTPVSRVGSGNWQTIAGDPHEFTFVHNGGNGKVGIRVGMDPASSVGFSVYNDLQWRDLSSGDRTVKPVGSGTPNSNLGGDLYWEDAGRAGGLYHVQVYSRTGEEARYWIDLSGASSGLTAVPTAQTAPAAAAAAAPAVKATATATPTVKSTTAAAPAAKPTATVSTRTGIGNWQLIDGTPQEFTFQYAGRGQHAGVHVGTVPSTGVGFSVYTDTQWREHEKAVGHGTHNPYDIGDLSWSIDGPGGGLYHVQVYAMGTEPAHFWIEVDGAGASNLKAVSPPAAVE